jgi:putative lipoprotein
MDADRSTMWARFAVADPLVGTRWLAAAIGPTSLDGDPRPGIAFEDEGRVTGHTGVNRFAGTYTVAGHRLAFGPLEMTGAAGPPEAMQLERRFVATLSGPCSFQVSPHDLTIKGDAEPIWFRPL